MLKYLLYSIILFLMIVQINGQFLNSLKNKVKEKTEESIDKEIDKIINEDDSSNIQEETDESGINNNSPNAAADSAGLNQPGFQTYSKFDFIPGEEIIFFDDFSDVPVGEFPLKWNTTASGEIVTTSRFGGKWFKMMGEYAYYSPELMVPYPENFTIEYDVVFEDYPEFFIDFYPNESGYIDNGYYPGNGGLDLSIVGNTIRINYYDNTAEEDLREIGYAEGREFNPGELIRYSICGQKQRLKIYVNEEKLIDIPRAIPKKFNINYMRFGCLSGMIIRNFRFAVGAPDTRSRLLTEGILVTRGITFDSGSDVIKPESFGVIKEIADVLKENNNIKIKIVGHTDNDGSDESNLTLSRKRSASVKSALTNHFGIGDSRIITEGKGESEPFSGNDTPEGKANNRRVEFIKL